MQSENFRDCLDLLSKILNPDAKARATIPEIKRHPWYLGSDSLLEDSQKTLSRSQVCFSTVELVSNWGFDRESIVRDLMEGNNQSLRAVLYWAIESAKQQHLFEEDAGTTLTRQSSFKQKPSANIPTRNKSTFNIEPTLSGLRSASTPGVSSLPPVQGPSKSSSSPSFKVGSPLLSTFRRLFLLSKEKDENTIETVETIIPKDGPANDNMTSRPSSKLLADLEAIFRTMRLENQKLKDKRLGYKVTYGSLKFCIEITQLRNVQGMSGLKFERIQGDTSEYDSLVSQIMNRMRL